MTFASARLPGETWEVLGEGVVGWSNQGQTLPLQSPALGPCVSEDLQLVLLWSPGHVRHHHLQEPGQPLTLPVLGPQWNLLHIFPKAPSPILPALPTLSWPSTEGPGGLSPVLHGSLSLC